MGEYARRFREKESFVDLYTTEFPVQDTNSKWILVPKTQKLETKGIEVVVYKDKATGEEMPGIQLPCIIQLYGSSTGKKIFTMELPFLYVKKASLVITCSLGSMSQLSRECK